jgi:hypothetical protein
MLSRNPVRGQTLKNKLPSNHLRVKLNVKLIDELPAFENGTNVG